MKRIISLILLGAISTTSTFCLTQDQLIETENASATVALATSIIKFLSPHGMGNQINSLGDFAQKINTVSSYALQDQSFSANIASVVDHVATSTPWQTAKACDKDFFKKICIETIHGATSETVESGKDYLLTYFFTYLPGNMIFKRSVNTVSTALALSTFDIAANAIKSKLITQEHDTTESFIGSFFNYLIEQATYHALAEIIHMHIQAETNLTEL